MTENHKEDLKNIVKEPSKIFFDEQMSKHTSFKIGGPAEVLIKVSDVDTLKNIINYAKKNQIPITILGNGSNVLVLDGGIKGITLNIDIQKLEIEGNRVTVGAGNKITTLAYTMLDCGLTGMEELSGIPGTVGGVVYMNAGAHGKEIKDVVEEIKYLDENNNIKEMTDMADKFKYRKSIFSEKKYIILEATFELHNGNKKEIQEKMNTYVKYRKDNQPIQYPNAGSTFKRGEGFITAKLIDECGLKGYKIGGAEVSTKHAGFVVNKGNATAEDVLTLIKHVQEKVYEKFGKKIELEIKVIGEREI